RIALTATMNFSPRTVRSRRDPAVSLIISKSPTEVPPNFKTLFSMCPPVIEGNHPIKKQARRNARLVINLSTSDALHYSKNNDKPAALNHQIQRSPAATGNHFGIAPFHTPQFADCLERLLMIDAPHTYLLFSYKCHYT